jgi:hypothetical protein
MVTHLKVTGLLAPSLLTLRLRIRALNDGGLKALANIIKGGRCNIARLEISEFSGDLLLIT